MQNFDHNIFAENWGKSQKIVIITSTPVQTPINGNYLNARKNLLSYSLLTYFLENLARRPCQYSKIVIYTKHQFVSSDMNSVGRHNFFVV
jgi:hypothetical protein